MVVNIYISPYDAKVVGGGSCLDGPEYAHLGPGYYSPREGAFDGKVCDVELGNFILGKALPRDTQTAMSGLTELQKPEYAHLGPGYYHDGGMPAESDEDEDFEGPRRRNRPTSAVTDPMTQRPFSARARPFSARTTASKSSQGTRMHKPSFHMGGEQARFSSPAALTQRCPLTYVDHVQYNKDGWRHGPHIMPVPSHNAETTEKLRSRPSTARTARSEGSPRAPQPPTRPKTAKRRPQSYFTPRDKGGRGGAVARFRAICAGLQPQDQRDSACGGHQKWMGKLDIKADSAAAKRVAQAALSAQQEREQEAKESGQDAARKPLGWGVGGTVEVIGSKRSAKGRNAPVGVSSGHGRGSNVPSLYLKNVAR